VQKQFTLSSLNDYMGWQGNQDSVTITNGVISFVMMGAAADTLSYHGGDAYICADFCDMWTGGLYGDVQVYPQSYDDTLYVPGNDIMTLAFTPQPLSIGGNPSATTSGSGGSGTRSPIAIVEGQGGNDTITVTSAIGSPFIVGDAIAVHLIYSNTTYWIGSPLQSMTLDPSWALVYLASGADVITSTADNSLIMGGGNSDNITCTGHNCIIAGDVIQGTMTYTYNGGGMTETTSTTPLVISTVVQWSSYESSDPTGVDIINVQPWDDGDGNDGIAIIVGGGARDVINTTSTNSTICGDACACKKQFMSSMCVLCNVECHVCLVCHGA
jgi:hypothetical protein